MYHSGRLSYKHESEAGKRKSPDFSGLFLFLLGGASRSRTGLNGFAGRCITALLSRRKRTADAVVTARDRFLSDDRRGHQIKREAWLPMSGAGDETCTRTVSRCFPNTFFVGLASEDLNCSLVFRPRQQIRPKSSTDVQRAALSTPDPRSVHRRRRLPRTHHPRPVVCPASIIVKTIRQMVLVMAQVGCWERLHHNSQGPSAQAPLKERARWPPRFRTRFFVDISG